MKGGKTASGYTIVEVMIFLAVSGVLFVLAMVTINGQQRQANFAQGVRDFQAAMDDTVNDIRNGNFPDFGTAYTCTADSSNAPKFTGGGPTDTGTHGTHEKCTYLGKVAQFGASSNEVKVYTVVGRRVGAITEGDPKDFQDAKPTIPQGPGAPNFEENFTIPGGVEVTAVKVKKGPTVYDVTAIGFFSAFTKTTVDNDPLNDNLVQVVPIFGSDTQNVLDILKGDSSVGYNSWLSRASADSSPDVVVICLRHGSVGKTAALIIGGNKSRSSTSLHIDDADDATDAVIGGFTCPG